MAYEDERESGFVGMELKYCERCGSLWLRSQGTGQVYCSRCLRALAGQRPNAWRREMERQESREKLAQIEVEASLEALLAMGSFGGEA